MSGGEVARVVAPTACAEVWLVGLFCVTSLAWGPACDHGVWIARLCNVRKNRRPRAAKTPSPGLNNLACLNQAYQSPNIQPTRSIHTTHTTQSTSNQQPRRIQAVLKFQAPAQSRRSVAAVRA